MFSDNFRRGESEKSRFSGVKKSKLVSSLSDVAWKAFQSVNRRIPEGEAGARPALLGSSVRWRSSPSSIVWPPLGSLPE